MAGVHGEERKKPNSKDNHTPLQMENFRGTGALNLQ